MNATQLECGCGEVHEPRLASPAASERAAACVSCVTQAESCLSASRWAGCWRPRWRRV